MPPSPAAWCLLAAASLAGPRHSTWYDDIVLELPTHTEEDRVHLAVAVAESLDGRQGVELAKDGAWHLLPLEGLAALPVAALVALLYTAERRHRGAELDILVPEEGGTHRAVTVWWEPDGRVRLAVGDSVTGLLQAPDGRASAPAMPLVEEGAPWTARERAVLAAALARVEPRAHPALEGHPLVRLPGRAARDGTGASHSVEDGRTRLEFRDDTFLVDCCSFVGPAAAPVPASMAVVLHEVGHALVAWPALAMGQRYEAIGAEYERLWAVYEPRHEALSEAVRAYNASPSDAGVARVEALGQSTQEAQAAVEAKGAQLDALAATLRRTQRKSPVMTAWEQVPGHAPGPTGYSRASTEESFAESYALFHTDPEALRRAAPEVHAWLAAGRHLEAAGL